MDTLKLFNNLLEAKESGYNPAILCNGERIELTKQQLKEVIEALKNK